MTSVQITYPLRRLRAALAVLAAIVSAATAPAEVLYTVIDLGVPAGPYDRTFARSVNDSGQVAGYSDLSTGALTLGWRYTSSTGFVPLGLPPDFVSGYSNPYGINNVGHVVGDVSGVRAFRWSEGTGMVTLPTLPGGANSFAYAVNDGGQVAGSSGMTGAPSQRVARWSAANTIEDLGLPIGRMVGFGRAINNSGQLAVSAADSLGDSRGYLYTDVSGYRDLGSLGGYRVEAWGINDAGHLVGSSALPGGNVVHAFVWSEATGMQDLGALPGSSYSQAYAINNLDVIVGESLVAESVFHAFLRGNGMMQDLNSLIDPSQGWTLRNAWDISNSGLIVGWGVHNGQARSFLLTPVPEASALVLAGCAFAAIVGFGRSWRTPRRLPFCNVM
jgi:probable HAF family extracellular repeat protein